MLIQLAQFIYLSEDEMAKANAETHGGLHNLVSVLLFVPTVPLGRAWDLRARTAPPHPITRGWERDPSSVVCTTQSNNNNNQLLPKEVAAPGAAALDLEETLASEDVSGGWWCFLEEALLCPWAKMSLGLHSSGGTHCSSAAGGTF